MCREHRIIFGSENKIEIGYIFILHFSIRACSEQLSGSYASEIKHDHSPVVIVVLDPGYD